jgi:hypothetical protein
MTWKEAISARDGLLRAAKAADPQTAEMPVDYGRASLIYQRGWRAELRDRTSVVKGLLQMMRLTLLVVTLAIAAPAIGADQVPSCDVVRQRFAEAPHMLSLRLPNARFYREPSDRFEKHDVWKTEATRADDGELWYTTGLYCYGPKFDYIAADIDAPDHPPHPTFDLVAASIYAVTGWEADKVVRVANEVLRDRPSDIGKFKTVELWPGLYLEIEQVGFDIFSEKSHQ